MNVKTSGIVLCGGRSSRMGRPKACLPWFGRSMIEHVVETLRGCVDEVIVVTSETLDLPPLSARLIRDREPGRGPLAGICSGLAAARSERAFVTSTDAPFLSERFVRALFAGEGAAAPLAEGRVQVLSAVYPCEAWRAAEHLLARGVGRPLTLLEEIGFRACAPSEPGPRPAWRGFNTPREYLDCVREIDPGARATLELRGHAGRSLTQRRLEVPVGMLAEVLAKAPSPLELTAGTRVAPPYRVSLGGRQFVRDLDLPIGPGDRVTVVDSLVGH